MDPFYVTGGTLRVDAPSYVERAADRNILEELEHGNFCYVLTSRQMGKSSLMVRAVRTLRGMGNTVAVLDLTAIGQNLTVEQWYLGLLARLGDQIDLEDELEDYWEEQSRFSPVQRFFNALGDVVLQHRPGRTMIFIDEIDSVRSLPFSTDEFFSAMREIYNRRSNDPEYERITFCLLGVASPSDLIRDTRTTPFNIGRRIELSDFLPEEACALARGLVSDDGDLEHGQMLIRRVMYWTHGHPYLTQRLCLAVKNSGARPRPRDVDRICERMFLSEKGRDRNDNLVFVRERLLKSEVDLAELLHLYMQVLKGEKVKDKAGNPLVSILRLSGVTRGDNGILVVRNRIYAAVFSRHWVMRNMPDAALRRQREAYFQGIFRTATVSVFIVAVMTWLLMYARYQAKQAERERGISEQARIRAQRANEQVAETLKQMEMNQAEELFQFERPSTAMAYLAHVLKGDPSNRIAVQRLVEALVQRNFALPEEGVRRGGPGPGPGPGARWLGDPRDPREPRGRSRSTQESFAYSMDGQRSLIIRGNTVRVHDLVGEPISEMMEHRGNVLHAQFSPDGLRVVTASTDNTARLWDALTGKPIGSPMVHKGPVMRARFNETGLLVVTASLDKTARVWSVPWGEPVTEPLQLSQPLQDARFESGDIHVVTVARRGERRVWDIRPRSMVPLFLPHTMEVLSLRFSRDGRRMLTAGQDGVARIWDPLTGQLISDVFTHHREINSARFSPDGTRIVTASEDYTARIWDVQTGVAQEPAIRHEAQVISANFSENGRWVISTSRDGTVKIHSVEDGTLVGPPLVHAGGVQSAAFNRDATRVITASRDRTARIWDPLTGAEVLPPLEHEAQVVYAEFDPKGERMVTASMDNTARIWDARTGAPVADPLSHSSEVRYATFSPDGSRVVTVSRDRTARVWDALTGEPIGFPLLHDSAVVYASFLPDGASLLTASADASARLWDAKTGTPLTEFFSRHQQPDYSRFQEGVYEATRVSPDGRLLGIGTKDGSVRVFEFLKPPLPVTDWFPEVAEHVGGERLNRRGLLESTAWSDITSVIEAENLKQSEDFYGKWLRWFLEPPLDRKLSPFSGIQVREVVDRWIQHRSKASLASALALDPHNPRALAAYAALLLEQTETVNNQSLQRALFLSHKATEWGASDAWVWRWRATILAAGGGTQQAAEAWDRAILLANEAGDEALAIQWMELRTQPVILPTLQ